MADHFIQQIKNITRHLSLHAEEKARMRAALEEHLSLHPLHQDLSKISSPSPSSLSQNIFQKPSLSPYTFKKSPLIMKWALRSGVFLIIISLVTGTGVVTASEQALPGDSLYATKIAIEDIKSNLKTESEAKIAYEVTRTSKRFEEIHTLANQGELDTEKSTIIATHIKEHTQTATDEAHKVARSNTASEAETDVQKEALIQLKETLIQETAGLEAIQQDGVSFDVATFNENIATVVAVTQDAIVEVTNTQEIVILEGEFADIKEALTSLELEADSLPKTTEIEEAPSLAPSLIIPHTPAPSLTLDSTHSTSILLEKEPIPVNNIVDTTTATHQDLITSTDIITDTDVLVPLPHDQYDASLFDSPLSSVSLEETTISPDSLPAPTSSSLSVETPPLSSDLSTRIINEIYTSLPLLKNALSVDDITTARSLIDHIRNLLQQIQKK
jgi:hypothetical protein